MRLWERIHETLGERIHKDFVRIHETLGEDL